eukprot:COSAG02_NODE_2969_length_7640_cov_2.657870_5_plen_91_part_00
MRVRVRRRGARDPSRIALLAVARELHAGSPDDAEQLPLQHSAAPAAPPRERSRSGRWSAVGWYGRQRRRAKGGCAARRGGVVGGRQYLLR